MKIPPYILLPIIILLTGSFMSAAQSSASVNIQGQLLTTHEGLPNNTVRHIMQDKEGYLWFSTLDGIARYDGYNFITYRRDAASPLTLTDQSVRSTYEDSNKFIWINGANDHVNCLDPKTGRFIDFTGGQPAEYRYLREIGGVMWLWGEKGALSVTYTDGKLTTTPYGKKVGNLPSDNIVHLGVDHEGHVWLTSGKAIYRIINGIPEMITDAGPFLWLVPVNGTYTLYIKNDGSIFKYSGNGKNELIAKIKVGPDASAHIPGQLLLGNTWYIFTSEHAIALDLASNRLSDITGDLNLPGAKVIEDTSGNFWLHNETGNLVYVNHITGATKTFSLLTTAQASLLDMERYGVARDSAGNAWISTKGNGLFFYDMKSGEMKHFHEGDRSSRIVPSNELLCVFIDRSGTVWTGSDYTGASRIDIIGNAAPLNLAGIESSEPQSRSFRLVKRISDGDILLGTRSGALLRYSADLSKLKSSESYPSIIYDATEDNEGRLWLATRGSGIYVDGVNYTQTPNDPGSLPNANVFALCTDDKGRVWIGTMGGGMALAVSQPDGSYKFRQFFNDTYSRRRIRSIAIDVRGNVWAASNDGLLVFDPDSLIFDPQKYVQYNLDNHNFKGDVVHCVVRDNYNTMWIGGAGFGLAVSRTPNTPDKIEFEYISPDKGLVNNTVVAITPIRDGIIAATEYGLSRLDTNGNIIENYILSTNPKSNVYSSNTALTLNDTTVIVGSIDGLFALNPFTMPNERNSVPEVRFTGISVNGNPLPSTAQISGMGYSEEIELKYNQNNVEIDFSTLEYSSSDIASYSYILEPYDKTWSRPSTLNYATYKNLEPGHYTLHVKAARKDGKWGEESTLEITVLPPWYATWWAKLLSLILVIILAFIIFRVTHRINRLHNRVKLEKQLTDYKLEFFTNISHEFRTPLTLMQVSLEKIHEVLSMPEAREIRRNIRGHLNTLDKNSRRMSRLINELLTFRKVEKNKLTLNPRPTEVTEFLRDIFDTFRDEARQKQINYVLSCPIESYTMNIDRDSLDKIVHNLLSNAVKYTLQGGSVEMAISVNEPGRRLVIKVRDNGIGIPAEKKAQLFSRFMQSNFSHNSIGVGLHLTYGLVQLYGGAIYHEDNTGGGSIFTVEIPTDLPATPEPEETIAMTAHSDEKYLESDAQTAVAPPETGHKLLIIDDDSDIREVLTREFSQYFEVITAADGTSGLKAARDNDVSLIICDVMMPDMSGFEVTRRLKEDIATSHIPIIQLTALSNDESHTKGIETGADAYITKPFSLTLLKTRVFKLIELRKLLQAKFSSSPTVPRPELPMVSHDREFYDRLYEVVQAQMGNSEFSADDFASQMNMGRTIFFKKVKGVTGYGPKEFLRIMRMKHAAELLLTTDLTISEIAYTVGLSDPAYFNRCFKAQFGKAPSVYQKENRQE